MAAALSRFGWSAHRRLGPLGLAFTQNIYVPAADVECGLYATDRSVRVMNDILYLAGTLAFFGLMLGYVAACARLGRSGMVKERDDDAR